MFKRRTPRSYPESVARWFYPRGGWWRAIRYIVHRLRRLPDPAHKISRGIAVGVFASFTPFFGLHFVIAGCFTYFLRGNILASLLATFIGNPVTFPVIAAVAVGLGTWMLGLPPVPPQDVFASFSHASVELWHNFLAVFTPDPVHWAETGHFFRRIFLPYLIGGIGPGFVTGIVAYYLSYPVIASYQKGRIARLKERFEARRLAAEETRALRYAREEARLAAEREEALRSKRARREKSSGFASRKRRGDKGETEA